MKSGFVSIIGRTNAGKSTLINSLLEEKIALVSHKQNATRRKIKAIMMHEKNQIIFIDTQDFTKAVLRLINCLSKVLLNPWGIVM